MSSASLDCVRVAVRVRPFVPSELDRGCHQIVEKTLGLEQLKITGESFSLKEEFYTFNNVLMMDESQEEVYNKSVEPMIRNLFEGFNVTILAYGQTGSGKTYTMGTCFDGDWASSLTGIIPRALQDIFNKIRMLKAENASVNCTCSFMELYCENLYDLLSGREKEASTCDIREDISKGIFIKGLSEHQIEDETKAAKFLMEGGAKRTTGATAMNDVSSRSHAIFTINITTVGSNGHSTEAKFSLVDLAGSERSKKTKTTGVRFTEGVKINEGLLALGNVISALGGGSSSGFVSYRDSKLTRLLQDSLGGNSMTLMIACVSPADYNIEETLSTLRYADRAKKIRNKPVKNQDPHQAEIQRLIEIIEELKVKLMRDEKVLIACGIDCIKVKTDLYDENQSMRQQLKNLSVIINDLRAAKLNEETFRNKFIARFQKFREVVMKITSGIYVPDLTKMVEVMDEMISGKSQDDVTNLDESIDDENKFIGDETGKRMMLEYTAKKVTAKKQIKKIERAMKAKQKFLDLHQVEDETVSNYEITIKALESELDELRSLVTRRDVNATIINVDRKEKISSLEKELIELRKKCGNFDKSKKQAESDKKRIDDLKRELLQMKATRSQLILQQQAESKRFKVWIASRDKEIRNLTQKGRKLQSELDRKDRQHEKQQAALKREVDKAKAVNKKLQEAIERSKKIRSSKVSAGDIRAYLDSELMVLVSAIDAKIAMQSLMNQREFMTEKLLNLRAIVVKSEDVKDEMDQVEGDLATCNAEISEIRQKVMETDVDEKLKTVLGNFNSVDALQIALGHVMRVMLEEREEFTIAEMKVEDLQVASEMNKTRIAQMFQEMCSDKKQYERMKLGMEHDFVMKLTVIAEDDDDEDESQVHPLNVTYTLNCSREFEDSVKLETSVNRSRKRSLDGEIKLEVLNDSMEVQKSMSRDDLNPKTVEIHNFQVDWNKITEPQRPHESKPRQLSFEEEF